MATPDGQLLTSLKFLSRITKTTGTSTWMSMTSWMPFRISKSTTTITIGAQITTREQGMMEQRRHTPLLFQAPRQFMSAWISITLACMPSAAAKGNRLLASTPLFRAQKSLTPIPSMTCLASDGLHTLILQLAPTHSKSLLGGRRMMFETTSFQSTHLRPSQFMTPPERRALIKHNKPHRVSSKLTLMLL